jgi:hypothetical protein
VTGVLFVAPILVLVAREQILAGRHGVAARVTAPMSTLAKFDGV